MSGDAAIQLGEQIKSTRKKLNDSSVLKGPATLETRRLQHELRHLMDQARSLFTSAS